MTESDLYPDDEGRSRENRPSVPLAKSARGKRRAEPHPEKTRVRFEFARHAHQREITPKLGINPAKRRSQEESGEMEKKVKESYVEREEKGRNWNLEVRWTR
jgi:hypothetical protein